MDAKAEAGHDPQAPRRRVDLELFVGKRGHPCQAVQQGRFQLRGTFEHQQTCWQFFSGRKRCDSPRLSGCARNQRCCHRTSALVPWMRWQTWSRCRKFRQSAMVSSEPFSITACVHCRGRGVVGQLRSSRGFTRVVALEGGFEQKSGRDERAFFFHELSGRSVMPARQSKPFQGCARRLLSRLIAAILYISCQL